MKIKELKESMKTKCKHKRKGIFQGKAFCKNCKLILNENVFKNKRKKKKGKAK